MKIELDITEAMIDAATSAVAAEIRRLLNRCEGASLVSGVVAGAMESPELLAMIQAEARRQLPDVVRPIVENALKDAARKTVAQMRKQGTLFPLEMK